MRKTKELGIKVMGALAAVVFAVSAAHAAGTNRQIQETYAVEFTVKVSKAVLYSNDKTTVYKQPDISAGVVTVIAKDLPVSVTGITSNGWFQVSLNGTY